MADREGDHDPSANGDVPLGDVVDAIQQERTATGSAEWARLEETAGEFDPEEVWDQLTSGSPRTVETTVDRPEGTETTDVGGGTLPAAEAISSTAKLLHGYFTAMMLLAGAVLYMSVAIGVLPEHLWVLSIPFLAIGLFLVVPILAYYLGIWEPTRLAMEEESDRTTDTSDLPDVDTVDLE